MLKEIIEAFWIVGTILLWFAIVGLAIWVIGWGVRFKFWATDIGLIIWAFSFLLLLLVANNIVGNFGSSTRDWWVPAPNDFVWWYFTRFIINAGIVVVIIKMLDILRKHWVSRDPIDVRIPAREPRPRTDSTPTIK